MYTYRGKSDNFACKKTNTKFISRTYIVVVYEFYLFTLVVQYLYNNMYREYKIYHSVLGGFI